MRGDTQRGYMPELHLLDLSVAAIQYAVCDYSYISGVVVFNAYSAPSPIDVGNIAPLPR